MFQSPLNAAVYAARNLRRLDMDGNDLGISQGSVRTLRALVTAEGRLPREVMEALRESGNEDLAHQVFPDLFGGDAARRRAESVVGCVQPRVTPGPQATDGPSASAAVTVKVLYDPRTRSHYWARPDGSEITDRRLPPPTPGAVFELRADVEPTRPEEAVAHAMADIEKVHKRFTMDIRPEDSVSALHWTGAAVIVNVKAGARFSDEQIQAAVTRHLERAGLRGAQLLMSGLE